MHPAPGAFVKLRRVARTVPLAVLAVPAVAPAQMRTWEWRGEMHPVGVWVFGVFLLFLTFCAVVIAGAIVGFRWLLRSARGAPDDPAISILRERYARGEIGREEFEAKLRDLRPHS